MGVRQNALQTQKRGRAFLSKNQTLPEGLYSLDKLDIVFAGFILFAMIFDSLA